MSKSAFVDRDHPWVQQELHGTDEQWNILVVLLFNIQTEDINEKLGLNYLIIDHIIISLLKW